MINHAMSEDELQHIEHANKVLREHEELVKHVVNATEEMLNTYIPILRGYIDAIMAIRATFGQEVKHIAESTRELKLVTGSTQGLQEFIQATLKLDTVLTPSLIEKLRKLTS